MKTSLLPLLPIFLTILFTEFGDRTQVATMLFASERLHSPFKVYMAVVLALAVSSGFSVIAGHLASKYLTIIPFKLVGGIGFILIGIWTIIEHYRT